MPLIARELQAFADAEPSVDSGQWIEAPLLEERHLLGTSWQFGDLNGGLLSPFFVLAPGGLVGGFVHPQIDAWQVFSGHLCLINAGGLPTIIFNVAQVDDSGITTLAGRAVIGGVDTIYVLKVSDHPPHRIAATAPSVLRRAAFLRQPAADARRPNLVVVHAGSTSSYGGWLEDVVSTTRSWDLCVSWSDREPPAAVHADYLAHRPDHRKFRAIFDLFHEGSPLWNYDRVWLPDDDLLCSGQDLNRLFHISRKYGLDLAQPSLRHIPECHINHPVTAQRPDSDVRMEPFVEIMCPLFSKLALQICIGSFENAVSGYGLDHLWPSLLGMPATRMGVIDAIGVIHTPPNAPRDDVRSALAEQSALWNSYGFNYAPIAGVR